MEIAFAMVIVINSRYVEYDSLNEQNKKLFSFFIHEIVQM